jgi:hypothetical protein
VAAYVEVAFRDYLTVYSQGWQLHVTEVLKRLLGREPAALARRGPPGPARGMGPSVAPDGRPGHA